MSEIPNPPGQNSDSGTTAPANTGSMGMIMIYSALMGIAPLMIAQLVGPNIFAIFFLAMFLVIELFVFFRSNAIIFSAISVKNEKLRAAFALFLVLALVTYAAISVARAVAAFDHMPGSDSENVTQ
ncbi:MAG: hypothetical protein RR060_00920 [Victivallaceae bacterium]